CFCVNVRHSSVAALHVFSFFFLHRPRRLVARHSFPTRRSSDLTGRLVASPRQLRAGGAMIATRGETVRASGGASKVAALDAAGWLLLAAAPTFVVMALLTGVLDSGGADMPRSPAHDAS